MKEMLVSLAPTTTILAFFTILASESILLVEKHRANGDSISSSGSRWQLSTLFFMSSSFFLSWSSDSNRSWSHFLSIKCGNRLVRTWTNSWKIVGMIVLVCTSKYRHDFCVRRSSSLSMNRVDFSKIGFTQEYLSLVWLFLSCSLINIWS